MLINLPKLLKIIFKKYTMNGNKGSKIDTNVELDIVLKKTFLEGFLVKEG